MKFLRTKSDQNIHQNAPNCTILKKFLGGGGMPPNPPSKAHGFAMRSISLRDMQICKSEKRFLGPPPAKSWGRPWVLQTHHYSKCSGTISSNLFHHTHLMYMFLSMINRYPPISMHPMNCSRYTCTKVFILHVYYV